MVWFLPDMCYRLTKPEQSIMDAKRIEQEHELLRTKLSECKDLVLGRAPVESVSAAGAELMECARVHFEHEEEAMQRYNYRACRAHRLEHDHFLRGLRELLTEVASHPESSPQLLVFVHEWLVHHIPTFDDPMLHHIRGTDFRLSVEFRLRTASSDARTAACVEIGRDSGEEQVNVVIPAKASELPDNMRAITSE